MLLTQKPQASKLLVPFSQASSYISISDALVKSTLHLNDEA